MKRLHCPKCDEPILFDDSLYQPGRTLVFECPSCRKQFKIRVGMGVKPSAEGSLQNEGEEREEKEPVGYLVVIENAFHLRQEVPLYEGENRVGKHVRGTNANAAFKTVDPSVDNTHCIISVQKNKQGHLKFILRDGPSGTGTFVMNELVGVKERVNLSEGAIITLGASTLILHIGAPETDEN
ncbi:FHA domain-containing protein [Alloprevotella sp. Lung230]|uniref:FHA domain-containing protein n=1 Tax=Alloprevotella sp. Lung230 TaxID=2766595 RepID=UPI001655BC46|nr:FHA domain-containing protein [Alloprevotella sp. Lung230]MBC8626381.1 FHA domain-containing protein [Alloprevotella sp. Lung230]